MSTFDDFETDLRDALAHLYDPLYEAPASLWVAMSIDPERGVPAIQRALIRSIEDLRPAQSVPRNATIRRFYDLLSYRFLQGLTQEETAERMSLATRYLRAQQRKALRVLARSLWESEHRGAFSMDDRTGADETRPAGTPQSSTASGNWSSQVRQELASLEKGAPQTNCHVEATLRGLREVGRALTTERGTALVVAPVQPDVIAMIHPAALRQVVLAGIANLAERMSSGAITVYGERDGDTVKVSITGSPAAVDAPYEMSFVREILAATGGSLDLRADGDTASLLIELPAAPSANTIPVVVVDDNADLISCYQAYTEGTRYQIVPVPDGRHAFETIEARKPGIIVLDVMLPDPDIDGWELLVHLRGHPGTRQIPIIVCSVVRDEQMALTLGAAKYLAKPVRCEQFIEALDEVLSGAPAGAPGAAVNSAKAG